MSNLAPLLTDAHPPADLLAGTWAMRAVFPVVWNTFAIRLIRDQVVVRGRLHREPGVDGSYLERIEPCAIELPPYHIGKAVERQHRFILPDNLFDQRFFPPSNSYAVRPEERSSFTFNSDRVVLLAGMQLDNALGDAWPERTGSLEEDRGIDADLDGAKGIAVLPDTRDGRVAPHAWPDVKLTGFHAAVRLRFTYRVQAVGTDEMRGTVAGVGERIDSRVFSVDMTRLDGTRGRTSRGIEAGHVDGNIKLRFDRTRAAHLVMRRVADSATIRQVRELALT